VSVEEGVRLADDPVAQNALDGEPSAVDLGRDGLDDCSPAGRPRRAQVGRLVDRSRPPVLSMRIAVGAKQTGGPGGA
jgi:hypothetical protein